MAATEFSLAVLPKLFVDSIKSCSNNWRRGPGAERRIMRRANRTLNCDSKMANDDERSANRPPRMGEGEGKVSRRAFR